MQFPSIRSPFVVAALLTLICLVAFGAVLPGEFVVDDLLWSASQPAPLTLSELFKAFGTWGFQETDLKMDGPPIYRPLQSVFFKLVHVSLGNTAWKFHLLSITLHIGCCFLLWLLLGRLLPALDPLMRFLVTLTFAVHPAGSEAVLWIAAMSELTVTAALVSTFFIYLRWRENWSPWRIAGMATLCLIVCLWKETGVALPMLVLAYELTQQQKFRQLPWTLLAALLVAALVFLFLRHGAIGSMAGGQKLILNFVRGSELVLAHWRFLFLPDAPPFALRPPEISLVSVPSIIAALAVLAGIAWSCVRTGNAGLFTFGFAWLALSLWPAYAVAIVGEGFFNGRQAYIAAVGVAIMLAAFLAGIPGERRLITIAAAGIALTWMAFSTASNALTWKSNADVYVKAAQVSPNAHGPRAGIAGALVKRGDIPGALARYAEALERSVSVQDRGTYLYAMASLQGQNGNTVESNRLLQQLIEQQPRNSFAWVGLGNNAWATGRLQEAISHYRKAAEIDPKNFEAASNLAGVLTASGPEWASEASFWRIRAMAIAVQSKK